LSWIKKGDAMQQVWGITGHSGSGKTTLIERMLPVLAARGLSVNVIKHSHHELALEPPGKDSARFRAAGAAEVLVASPHRFAIVHDLRGAPEPTLAEQLARLSAADLTLVEGFKNEAIPKIEVWRAAHGRPLLAANQVGILAVATTDAAPTDLPCLDLNDAGAVVDFILTRMA
jgi:molybdopterin-guanine dinucleotide biosynthesis protein B